MTKRINPTIKALEAGIHDLDGGLKGVNIRLVKDGEPFSYASAVVLTNSTGELLIASITNDSTLRPRKGTEQERELILEAARRALEAQAAAEELRAQIAAKEEADKAQWAAEAQVSPYTAGFEAGQNGTEPPTFASAAEQDECNRGYYDATAHRYKVKETTPAGVFYRTFDVKVVNPDGTIKGTVHIGARFNGTFCDGYTGYLTSAEREAVIEACEEYARKKLFEPSAREATQAIAEEYGAAGVEYIREALAKAYELGRKAGAAQ